MEKKNFFKKHKWKVCGGVAVLVVGLLIWRPRSSTTTSIGDFVALETIVGTGDLETSLTLQGTTQFSDSQKLSFMNKGKVKSVNVKVGDNVKKGQILAQITTDDLDSQLDQARTSLDDLNRSLQDLLDARNLELEYLQQKANYDSLVLKQKTIDQDHSLALESLQQQIRDAEKAYTDAKADYEELLSGSNSASADLALSSTIRQRNTTFQNAVLGLKDIINTVTTALDTYDQKMLLTSTYRETISSTNYVFIGANNTTAKEQSEKGFWEVSALLKSIKEVSTTLENKAISDLTEKEILDAYVLVRDLGNAMISWGESSYRMFKDSVVGDSYPQSEVDADASAALKNQSTGISYVQKYSSTVDALAAIKEDTSLEDTKLKMDKAKTAWDKVLLQVDTLKTEQEKEKADLQNNLDTIQRNINKIRSGESLNETQIISARNRITQQERTISNLLDKYEDYRLEANFDGVITQMDIQVGDSIDTSSNTASKYIYVENNNVLEMALSVEQVDIIKLKVGMDVVVYLDAYPNLTYNGIITEINTVPTSSSNLTTYDVTVTFEKNDPEEVILAGMGGNAKIITASTKDVLLVPSQAITRKDENSVVLLYKNGQWIDQIVETGESDDTNTEVLSGLAIGDKIKAMYITEEGMSSAGIISTQGQINLGTMGGGGMGGGFSPAGGGQSRGGTR
ncbi:MAG: biotin/lipoyl-binding protein [Candidatus Absconditabacteria bacterium]|nr:biotin/lipoyl-binding protein [Candidatus Absconditabacteria bacterium]MDD3868728.1 biotin/lipoyl-binding protein [Candidatus Absconditabacteria bacterium]MDD4714773.1 biotin/lipoyl-binding protein [Candidatus Absconditabacteria bacterium]